MGLELFLVNFITKIKIILIFVIVIQLKQLFFDGLLMVLSTFDDTNFCLIIIRNQFVLHLFLLDGIDLLSFFLCILHFFVLSPQVVTTDLGVVEL